MVQKVGILKEKQVFYMTVLLHNSQIFGLRTLNHCMILHLVIVCISFDSV